jgi:hypothetical protein
LRDLQNRDAEESFLFAQEWTYLAAKAAQFKVNGSRQVAEVGVDIENIIHARAADKLLLYLDQLKAKILDLYKSQGTQTSIREARISLRDYVAQNNYVQRDANGDVILSAFNKVEVQTGGQTSDQAWTSFLTNHFSVENRVATLEIPFSTSLDRIPPPEGLELQARGNPVFSDTRYDELITYNTALPNANGVKVRIKGRQLTVGSDEVTVNLRQQGVSYVRSQSWNVAPDDGIRFWNLEPRSASITAQINDSGGVPSPQFHERSPANSRWVLSITSSSLGNQRLLQNLSAITDIEVIFYVRGFSN